MNNAIYGKNNQKLEKQNWCKTRKQQNKPCKMYIETKVYVAQNLS